MQGDFYLRLKFELEELPIDISNEISEMCCTATVAVINQRPSEYQRLPDTKFVPERGFIFFNYRFWILISALYDNLNSSLCLNFRPIPRTTDSSLSCQQISCPSHI